MKKKQTASMTDAYNCYLTQVKSAERVVIGAIILESDAIQRVSGILKPEYFLSESHSCIFSAVFSLWSEGQKPDMVKICERLLKDGKIETAGGMYEISNLATSVASTSNLEEHAMFVREAYTQRCLLDTAGKIQNMAMDVSVDIGDQVVQAMKMIEQVANDMDYNSPIVDMAEATDKAMVQYEQRELKRISGDSYGLMTGLTKLDQNINGFKPGELIVIGARPGMGKTSLLLHFARNIASKNKVVGIFSLEMTDVSLANRIILSYADVRPEAYKGGWMNDEEKKKVFEAVSVIRGLPIMIDETPNMSVQQIKIRSMNLKRKIGLSVIMIDYLQLMNTRGENRQYNREQEIAQTTRQLKQLAKELEVPIILLSQLNRNVETKLKDGKKITSVPGLSDLRESGAIEQDADVVLLIHRPEYYGDTDAVKGVGLINIAKQRDGVTGKVKFAYNESLTRLTDVDEYGSCPF